jgi:FeS assembly SUF system protein
MTDEPGTTPPPRRFDVEIVDQPPAVPRGTVPAAAEPRHRDYLEGFLAASGTGLAAEAAGTAAPGVDAPSTLDEQVVAALRDIFDPEIPVNIYDLGLVYDVEVAEGHVIVTMTLTTPHCPVAESLPGEVETRLLAVPGVATAEVRLVWTPPWDPQKMSDEAKLELGML